MVDFLHSIRGGKLVLKGEKKMVTVAVSYRVGGQIGLEEKLRELAKKHGGKSGTSEYGLGQQDLEFSFRKVKPAKAFREETKTLIGENGTVSSLIFRVCVSELLKIVRRRAWE
jgi:hypothetical protein